MLNDLWLWILANPYPLIGLLLVPAIPLILFNLLPFLVVMERRGAAFIQDRPGPDRAGIWIPFLNTRIRAFGTIFNICDFLKLATKETFLPRFADRVYYAAGPMIPLMIALIVPAFIPFFAPIAYRAADGSVGQLVGQAIASQSGLLALFAFSSLSVYGIVLGAWASNSKYSLLGGMRSSAMMISYEVSLGLSAAGMFLIAGSFSLADIVAWQGAHVWGAVAQPLGFVLFTVAMFAECNRNPFDVVEGESEIVAGFHTEYGAIRFMLFMSAEYYHLIIASALISVLFLGGWLISPVPLPIGDGFSLVSLDSAWMKAHCCQVLAALLACAAVGLMVAAALIANRRRAYLRLGASDAAIRGREYRIYATAFTVAAGAAAGAAAWLATQHPQPIDPAAGIWSWQVDLATALAQFGIVIAKTMLVAWLFVWVRWTLPRFRYDQIMALGWKVMLNLALLNLLITAIIVRLVKG